MEFKYNKNSQLRVRLAIIESQLKQVNDEIRRLKQKDSCFLDRPFQFKSEYFFN